MYKNLKRKVNEINDELEDADFVSTELLETYFELEKELESEIEMNFGNEKEKIEKLLKRLLKIKADNDIL